MKRIEPVDAGCCGIDTAVEIESELRLAGACVQLHRNALALAVPQRQTIEADEELVAEQLPVIRLQPELANRIADFAIADLHLAAHEGNRVGSALIGRAAHAGLLAARSVPVNAAIATSRIAAAANRISSVEKRASSLVGTRYGVKALEDGGTPHFPFNPLS